MAQESKAPSFSVVDGHFGHPFSCKCMTLCRVESGPLRGIFLVISWWLISNSWPIFLPFPSLPILYCLKGEQCIHMTSLINFSHNLHNLIAKALKFTACQSTEHNIPHLPPSIVSPTGSFVPVYMRPCRFVVYMCFGKHFLTAKNPGRSWELKSTPSQKLAKTDLRILIKLLGCSRW